MHLARLCAALATTMPGVMRWAGSAAKSMRGFNVALSGKQSGSSNTDALTLADLTVQELLVGALRDSDPMFRDCRMEAEESTGDLSRFASQSTYTIALDPIDGTKQYRDRTGNGYALILTLRSVETVHYSLVYVPESHPQGGWVEVAGRRLAFGPDDHSRPAIDVLRELPFLEMLRPEGARGRKVYVIGFQSRDAQCARLVSETGLEGVAADDCPGCLYELMARGEFVGSLIHSPNVYDFPAGLHVARALGGDSVWVQSGQSVHFRETWHDDRASMLRLPGIIATSVDRSLLEPLCQLARGWNPVRYAE